MEFANGIVLKRHLKESSSESDSSSAFPARGLTASLSGREFESV